MSSVTATQIDVLRVCLTGTQLTSGDRSSAIMAFTSGGGGTERSGKAPAASNGSISSVTETGRAPNDYADGGGGTEDYAW